MRLLGSVLAVGAALAVSLAGASRAHADDGDGAYGRLDGDVLLVGEAGLAYVDGAPGLVVGGRALYLSTAGFYARYVEAFAQQGVAAPRQIGGGVELRPLFLARFAQDWEQGPPRLDLFLDSFALAIGTFWWSQPERSLDPLPGLELATSLEFPFTETGWGPRIGALASYRLSQGDAGVRGKPDIDARASFVALQLSWHGILDVGLVDVGDALVREAE
jgi:hypothetical protein